MPCKWAYVGRETFYGAMQTEVRVATQHPRDVQHPSHYSPNSLIIRLLHVRYFFLFPYIRKRKRRTKEEQRDNEQSYTCLAIVLNPNRSLDQLFNQSCLFQVCLCHISISFGILSSSLSRRSPLRLNFVDVAVARHSKQVSSALALRNVRQRCGQSARNKY